MGGNELRVFFESESSISFDLTKYTRNHSSLEKREDIYFDLEVPHLGLKMRGKKMLELKIKDSQDTSFFSLSSHLFKFE